MAKLFFISIYNYALFCGNSAQGTKHVGETCGSCFNPEANFDCGKCVPGLECVKEYKVKYFVKDDESDLLPDLPSRCRVTLGKKL